MKGWFLYIWRNFYILWFCI